MSADDEKELLINTGESVDDMQDFIINDKTGGHGFRIPLKEAVIDHLLAGVKSFDLSVFLAEDGTWKVSSTINGQRRTLPTVVSKTFVAVMRYVWVDNNLNWVARVRTDLKP